MNYIEYSKEKLKNDLNIIFNKISNEYSPDAVLFVSKGAFYIGLEASVFFNVPLFEIKAERKASNIKKILSPFLKLLPKNIKLFLRKIELNSGIHKKIENRNIIIKNDNIFNFKNILLVDDSVDTGSTILSIISLFKDKNINIKTFAINVMSSSFNNVKIDYFIYNDYIIFSDWSSDSNNYKSFLKDYYNWIKTNG